MSDGSVILFAAMCIGLFISTLTLFSKNEHYRGQGRMCLGFCLMAFGGWVLSLSWSAQAFLPHIYGCWSFVIDACGLTYFLLGLRKYNRADLVAEQPQSDKARS